MINDKRIEELCEGMFPLIAPFNPLKVSGVDGVSVISYGLSGAGYDLTLSKKFKVPITVNKPIDPKNVYKNLYNQVTADVIIVEPNNYILGVAKEHLDLPDTISGVCLTKSTYARVGIFLNMTPIEPGWKGYLTLEIANLSKSPVMVYANEGICQILFFEHGQSTTYGQGKYQNQPAEPIIARMKHE